MSRAPARHSSLHRFTTALVCAAGFACLLHAAAPCASQVPSASEPSSQPAPARAEGAAESRGVQILQHGTYPELRVDGVPFFINSAAFFYPRIPRSLWESSLDRYRELGINTIEISIPWNWHEPREGEIDFDGHTNPRRDLRGLLRMIAGHGFKLIVRPGPTVLHEWRNSGYPDWLLERPEYHMPLADRLEGREPPAAELEAADAEAAARLWLENPVHLAHAGKWLEAVAHELAPYRAGATFLSASRDSGGARTPGPGREISGPLLFVQVAEGPGSGRASTAGPEFWKYVETLCGILARGVDVPCLIDPAQPHSATAGSVLTPPVPAMGQWFLGPWSARDADEKQISPLDIAGLEFTVSSLAAQPAFPPALAEFSAGSFAPQDDARPELSPPENIRIAGHLLLGYGLRGLSWFPLQNTLTPAGYGTPGANRFYRWDVALSLNGARQPGTREVERIGDWLAAWGSQLAASHRRADFGLVDTLAALPREKLTRTDIAAVTQSIEQLERLAQYGGLSSELVDPEFQPTAQLLRHPLLLLPVYMPADPAYALSPTAQRALDSYVRGGGVLVCFPDAPAGAVFDRLQQGAEASSPNLPAGSRAWRAGAGRFVILSKDFYSWVSLHEDFADGMKRIEAPFARSLLVALLADAGVRQSVRREDSAAESSALVATELVTNEGTLPLGARSGGQAWLSVVNLSYDATLTQTLQVLSPHASARMEHAAAGDWIAVPVTLPPRESLLLPVDLRLCLGPKAAPDCADRVVSSGAELVRAEREGKTMCLTFYAPAKAGVRIHLADRPEDSEVDEAPVAAQWLKASHELVVELLRGASPRFLHVLRVPLSYRPALPERPKQDSRHLTPAHFRFSPAGAVRLPLGADTALLTNPPLFVFSRGRDAPFWVMAENLGEQGGNVEVRAAGTFNTSVRAYAGGKGLHSLNLKLPALAIETAATGAPAADGLYHGTLHFTAGADSEELPVAYALVPANGAVGYRFDFDADGSEERVLENSAVRAIFSPDAGGRLIALFLKSPERSLASTMGLLEDAFSFTPNPPGAPRDRARGRSGTFNRPYDAEWIPEADRPALRLTYQAPDVYPHGARIEKTARLVGDRKLAVEYRVALLPADARRLEQEAAGTIFAAPPPLEPVPQSFVILNSIPAEAAGASTTQFCWATRQPASDGDAHAEHCEEFLPGGPPISPPPDVRQLEIRQARRPALALEWADAGARLTLEPKNYSVLLRLVFPPLPLGGAAATYRIEFSVEEAQ